MKLTWVLAAGLLKGLVNYCGNLVIRPKYFASPTKRKSPLPDHEQFKDKTGKLDLLQR